MLTGYYEPSLVLLSIAVAVLASYTMLSLADRVASAADGLAFWWIAGGAFAMGTGIWAMHFLGMLAFRLPIPLGYDLSITLVSWLLPVLVSALALWRLSRPEPSGQDLAISAILFGLGINAMHYVGMAALRMQPRIVWDSLLVAVSIAIAIAASAAAIWIVMQLRRHRAGGQKLFRLGAALAMGGAIVGMHFTGMAAARFPADSICRAAGGQFGPVQLATLVTLATVSIVAISLLTSVYDARLEAGASVLALSQEKARERQEMLERERVARNESERLSALKDEFLATLSHELRTPLNVILGWAQMLRTRRDEATVLKGVEIIERNARLQAQLVADLLDMSSIVSGRVRLELQLTEAHTAMQAAVEAARPAAFAKRIDLVTRIEADCDPVWADPGRLQQVLWNLLSNATKFTAQDGHIEVSLACEAGYVVMSVTDDGCGIPADFLPFVFDRFRQADASSARRHGGVGLGLAICRQLVELHGGTITASSDGLGQGAQFVVRLPSAASVHESAIGEPHDPASASAATSRAAPALPNLSSTDVLVVDDDPDARDFLEHLLVSCGATVRSASSVEQALVQLEDAVPDVLVSDIGMPDVDGFALIRHIRSMRNPARSRIPAIALSAFTRSEDEARTIREGFDAYLPKPVDNIELTALIARLAGREKDQG
jgi:diguanylate cyclase